MVSLLLALMTRSTIDVAHFRYFVSERRGSWSPSRPNANLDNRKKNVFQPRAMGLFAAMQFDFGWGQFSGEVWSSLFEEPQKIEGEPLS